VAEIKIDFEKCTGCGTCVKVCPVGVYELIEDKAAAGVNADQCMVCRACENMCPEQAILVEETL